APLPSTSLVKDNIPGASNIPTSNDQATSLVKDNIPGANSIPTSNDQRMSIVSDKFSSPQELMAKIPSLQSIPGAGDINDFTNFINLPGVSNIIDAHMNLHGEAANSAKQQIKDIAPSNSENNKDQSIEANEKTKQENVSNEQPASSGVEDQNNQEESNNNFEITSELMTLDANKKVVLTLNQKEESAKLTTKEATIECKDKITLKCGSNSIEINSNSISIKCGASSVELSSSGVTIKGSSINLG
uniref:hypothetical protein n=1 Tax=Francisella sp. SYW-9 TaxID=2610888 RepID=UPI001CD09C09